MNFFSDNENFERGPPRHAGGNGNQGINFVWPYRNAACAYLVCTAGSDKVIRTN